MLNSAISQKKMVVRRNSRNKCRKVPNYHGVGSWKKKIYWDKIGNPKMFQNCEIK